MKKVLITGLSSYIGDSFATYCEGKEEISCSKISLRESGWEKASWSEYDVVLHVAGLAHVDVKHADQETRERYYRINRDLTIEAAGKAKAEGVKQFIYLSSIIVYGDSAPIGKDKCVTDSMLPAPANFYGDSKWQAEQGLLALSDTEQEDFKVAILRLPMVYGKDSKGNFPLLLKLSGKTPVFPKVANKRSMLYIENLCELVRQIVLQKKEGFFYPQNAELLSTSELMWRLARAQHRKIVLVPGTTWIWKMLSHVTGYINKIFGSLYYDESLSKNSGIEYCIYTVDESLERILNS